MKTLDLLLVSVARNQKQPSRARTDPWAAVSWLVLNFDPDAENMIHAYGQTLLSYTDGSMNQPALMDSSNGLLFLASKHFLRGGFNCFFSQMKNISTLERTSYLISKYSLNLQHLALICMCLTPGLTQFILITIHSLSTVTGYNRHNVLLLICSPLSSSSRQAYTALTLIRSTSRALHFKLFLLSELDLASSDCWKLMESS